MAHSDGRPADGGETTAPDASLRTAAALSAQAGDLLVQLGADGVVSWSSDGSVDPGTVFVALVDPRDTDLVGDLLADDPAGPVVVRWATDSGRTEARTATIVVIPRDQGWLAQVRGPRPTAGRAVVDPWHGSGAGRVVDGQQALDELAWLLSATPRTGKEIAVAAFDLDGFAETNAVLGQETGDLVLRTVADRVVGAVRSGDLVGRLEGDQFIVVLRGVHHLRGAIRVANKLRAAVEDPIAVPGGDVVQTISVGVTLVSLGEDVDGVLERAASAVAMAKAVGGNVVRSEPPI